jgi:hypothetical protein
MIFYRNAGSNQADKRKEEYFFQATIFAKSKILISNQQTKNFPSKMRSLKIMMKTVLS